MKKKISYIAEDGTEFKNQKQCLIHEGKNVCPKCLGIGTVQEKYNAYPTGLPDSGFIDDWKFRTVSCEVCNGVGFTEKALKPVIQTKVIGYQ